MVDLPIESLAVSETQGFVFVPIRAGGGGALEAYELYDLAVPPVKIGGGTTSIQWHKSGTRSPQPFADGSRYIVADGPIVELTAQGPQVIHSFNQAFDGFAHNPSTNHFALLRGKTLLVFSDVSYQQTEMHQLDLWFTTGWVKRVFPYRDGFLVIESGSTTLRSLYLPVDVP
jgi:hypothetical protein